MYYLRLFVVVMPSLLAPMSASAETNIKPDLAVALTKFGITMVGGSAKVISSSGKADVSPPDAAGISQDLSKLTARYQESVSQATFSADLVQSNGEVVITSAEIIAASTGVAIIPTKLIASAARYGNEKFSGYLADQGRKQALGILSSGLKSMHKTDRDKFDGYLRSNDYKSAANFLDEKTGELSKFENRLAKDTEAAQAMRNLLHETMKEGLSKTLIKLGETDAKTQDLEQKFEEHIRVSAAYAKKVSSSVHDLEDKTNDLAKDIKEATNNFEVLSQGMPYQLSLIQDVLFDQQSPETKLAMLEAGAKPGLNDEQYSALKATLKVEIRKQEILTTANKVVSIASDVNVILGNLNIHDERLNTAVQYGSIANTALSQAFSGNMLGAIATVSGLFGGGKPDPVHAQFQQVFVQLADIQHRLDGVIELQKKTLEDIAKLSQQLADVERKLHERLDNIDFELRVVSEATIVNLWDKNDPCMIADGIRGDYGFNDASLSFDSVSAISEWVRQQHGTVLPCAYKLRSMFSHLRNANKFGNPVRLEFAKDFFPESPLQGEDRTFRLADADYFIRQVYKPSYVLVTESWQTKAKMKSTWGSVAGAFAMLSAPATTATELRRRLQMLNQSQATAPFSACGERSLLYSRTKSLLCADTDFEFDPKKHAKNDAKAAKAVRVFLGEPVVRDEIPTLVRWAALVANAADFAPGGSKDQSPYSLDQLASLDIQDQPKTPYGKEILSGALMLTDIAIAQQVMAYGDLTAYFVFDELWDSANKRFRTVNNNSTERQKIADQLLRNSNNPWLQRNVAMLVLQSAERPCGETACMATDLKYQLSVQPFYELKDKSLGELVQIVPEQRQAIKDLLLEIFDLAPDVTFAERDVSPGDNIPISRRIVMTLGAYSLEIPFAADWNSKRLDYPPSVLKLIRERNLLAQRWADYNAFDGMERAAKIRIVHATSGDIL